MKTFACILLALLVLPAVFSLKGALGSANAIITVEVSPVKPTIVERYMTVYNENNETIYVELFPAEGLKNITEIVDNNFTLLPGEAKNASFRFVITEPGEYRGSVRVKFAPADRIGAGVGLDGKFRVFAIPKNETAAEPDAEKETGAAGTDGNAMFGALIVLAIVIAGIGAYFVMRKR